MHFVESRLLCLAVNVEQMPLIVRMQGLEQANDAIAGKVGRLECRRFTLGDGERDLVQAMNNCRRGQNLLK